VKLTLNGRGGKVGRVLAPGLEAAGHELVELDAAEAMIDFTAPDLVEANVAAALERGVPCVIGTTSFDQGRVDALARDRGIACFHAPNFALGAVLMMRFAREAAAHMPRAAIVEMHNEAKKDAPSGTARATAELVGGDPEIYSVRLPGLVAHQEVRRRRPAPDDPARHVLARGLRTGCRARPGAARRPAARVDRRAGCAALNRRD
jgi:4-hydroxy-tetrahydrodipicolinate reductase